MERAQAGPGFLPRAAAEAPAGIELRHLRYFVAVADAGSFTHAAERIFIAQPTLSQQIRRLEEIVGTPLLQRRHEGLRLTKAGNVLLDASRNVLSLDMVRVSIENHPLAATASLVWSGDLPRPLQQILFDAADSVASPPPARCAELSG